MKITIRKRNNTDGQTARLFFDIHDGGKRTRKTSPYFVYVGKRLNEKQKQHNAAAMAEAQKKADTMAHDATAQTETRIKTIGDLMGVFIDTKLRKGKLTAATIQTYKQMAQYIDPSANLQTFSAADAADSIRTAQEIGNNTKVLYLAKLNALLRFGASKHLLPADVLTTDDDDRLKNDPAERAFLTADELRLMQDDYNTTGKNWQRVFLFSCYTGLRYSDVVALTWDNIDTAGNVITIKTQKTKTRVSIPLNAAAHLLPEYQRGENVFDVPDASSIRKNLIKWAEGHGIKKQISFHTARHTFATLSLMAGADVYTICKLLGHHDIKTTQIYADVVDASKEKAVDGLANLIKH